MAAIPSLNLNRVRGPPPANMNGGPSPDSEDGGGTSTTPGGEGEHGASTTPPIEDYDGGDMSFRDYSAAPTPHTSRLDASELLGCSVYEINDVATLQARLVEAQRLFIALEQRYERALDAKERQFSFILKALAETNRQSVTTPHNSARELGNSSPVGYQTQHAAIPSTRSTGRTPRSSVSGGNRPVPHLALQNKKDLALPSYQEASASGPRPRGWTTAQSSSARESSAREASSRESSARQVPVPRHFSSTTGSLSPRVGTNLRSVATVDIHRKTPTRTGATRLRTQTAVEGGKGTVATARRNASPSFSAKSKPMTPRAVTPRY